MAAADETSEPTADEDAGGASSSPAGHLEEEAHDNASDKMEEDS